METPYQGRATIQDNITDLQITIPAKRNWFVIIFIGTWLGGWLMGEIAVPTFLLGGLGKAAPVLMQPCYFPRSELGRQYAVAGEVAFMQAQKLRFHHIDEGIAVRCG